MKKNWLKLLTLTNLVGTVAATISCGSKGLNFNHKDKDSTIMIVGKSGHNDKGFLQGGYDGAQQAIKQISALKKYSEIKISGASIPEAKNGTNKAIQAGAYIILGIGFQYPTFFNNQDYAGKYKDREFLGLDGSINATPDKINKNVTAIKFKAEQGAFLSGVATGLYLSKNYNTYSTDGGLKVGSFGGANFPAVTNMITGFMKGLAYFNDNLALNDNYKVKFIGWNDSKNGFTGGFVPSDSSVTKARELLQKKADVIFPVAGAQVSSMVDAINGEPSARNVKIIGVDSDQSIVFGKDGSKFITSALKDTGKATLDGLKAIYGQESLIKKGQNNEVGLDGAYVQIAKGQINTDEYLGKEFATILKSGQNLISHSNDALNIYKQLTSETNNIYKAAKQVAVDWTKAQTIFGFNGDKVLKMDDLQ